MSHFSRGSLRALRTIGHKSRARPIGAASMAQSRLNARASGEKKDYLVIDMASFIHAPRLRAKLVRRAATSDDEAVPASIMFLAPTSTRQAEHDENHPGDDAE